LLETPSYLMTRNTFGLLTALNGGLEKKLKKEMQELIDDYDKSGEIGAGRHIPMLDTTLQLTIETINRVSSDLASVRFIDDMNIEPSKVSVGTVAELLYVENKEVEKTVILGYWDAYLFQKNEYPECNNIDFVMSPDTPIAQRILGKKAGDIVQIKIPDGRIEVRILSIKKFDCKSQQAIEKLIKKHQEAKN